ncbi:MAG: 4-hydroxy-tetrahydrodipicolinate reductase [Parachlamydiaceae bacterium]
MKIALIGYGKMGQTVEKIALQRGHTIIAKICSEQWNDNDIEEAEMCVEFTEPNSALKTISRLIQLKKNLIIGTTGWYDQLPTLQKLVEEHQIGALYSPNFSTGIYLLQNILKHAAALMNRFPDYDVAEMESHHRQKKDAPSGTAIAIAETIRQELTRMDTIPISNLRCGSIPGTHSVIFDSSCDTITITHEARNREGFALGAVQAAEWLQGKKGLYTFENYMHAIIHGELS